MGSIEKLLFRVLQTACLGMMLVAGAALTVAVYRAIIGRDWIRIVGIVVTLVVVIVLNVRHRL